MNEYRKSIFSQSKWVLHLLLILRRPFFYEGGWFALNSQSSYAPPFPKKVLLPAQHQDLLPSMFGNAVGLCGIIIQIILTWSYGLLPPTGLTAEVTVIIWNYY